jgi:DivIVA domain-containing protein
MDVTPQELRGSEIKDSWRGYDRDEVDDLLERAAVTIEGLTQRVQEAASRPAPPAAAAARPTEAVPLPTSRDDADMLQRTLLLAQRAADDAVNEAQARARTLLDESEAKAQSLVSEAEANARRIAEGERRRLEAEIQDLSSRREQLRTDADALDSYASGYRDRLRAAIEADLAKLGGEVEPPQARPELHEVEIPPARDTQPAESLDLTTPDPGATGTGDGDGEPGSWGDGPETRAVGRIGAPRANAPDGPSAMSSSFESGSSRSAVSAPPRPATDWPPPAPTGDPAPSADSSWLTDSGEWAPSAQSWETPAPWDRDAEPQDARPDDTAQHAVFSSDVPMDANPVDTDSLDDDAFFASLREAVREDAPLGPRDEDQNGFYEDDGDQDRRRFRRRR